MTRPDWQVALAWFAAITGSLLFWIALALLLALLAGRQEG